MYSMKKPTLTKRRRAVLEFIRNQVTLKGQSPSLAEIAEACDFASRAAARKHVVALAEAGLIELAPGKARGARPSGSNSRAELVRESSIFELTEKDVMALDDGELRELVAKVALAAIVGHGLSVRHVIWGGDQRAADGGVDVRVQLPAGVTVPDIPRSITAFQVKATKLTPAEIHGEMCPGGILRPSIRAVIQAKGAYVIVAAEKVAASRLDDRLRAMHAAAESEPGAGDAKFDFYDARRLADLANRYPGVVAWVRQRIGKPIQGWHPYGQWASGKSDDATPFIEDTAPRLVGPEGADKALPLVEGLNRVRTLLNRGGQSVRLVGLSGVGKTRFVQALYELTVGNGALHDGFAVYTDLSEAAVPPPLALIDELVANRKRAVVVVDNCSGELHRQLAARCAPSAGVSLITIEYDITDDLPPETEVFRMEPASPDLIVEVIKQRYPHVSQIDARTISRVAGGNSRLAIAIAATVGRSESLADASDDEIFKRLFWQRKDKSDSLLRAAEACSLVYSFDGVNEGNELPKLAELAGMDVSELYRHVALLKRRDLVQARGVWRAVLPHAIANALARNALTHILPSTIHAQLVAEQGRLLQSFSRRLGFLNDVPEAKKIVATWLSEGSMLGDLVNLDKRKMDVLCNVAPVDQEGVLCAIERAGSAGNLFEVCEEQRTIIVGLLRSIAFEAVYFDRCMDILLEFALAEPEDNKNNSTRELIASMFFARLSGTHASRQQRFDWIKSRLYSPDLRIQKVACRCLNAALESHHFTSFYGFEFGARPRDYGYSPRTSDQVLEWYKSFVDLAIVLGARDSEVGDILRHAFIRHFRSLWVDVGIHDVLTDGVRRLMPFSREEIWLAIRTTLQFEGNGAPVETRERLQQLEALVRPKTLIEQTKAIVLTPSSASVDIDIGNSDGNRHTERPYERAEQRADELGRLVATDPLAFDSILPDLVKNTRGRQRSFGYGLAQGAQTPADLWSKLVAAYGAILPQSRNIQALMGFLAGTHDRDPTVFESLLDESLERPDLAELFPVLQTCVRLDERGVERLLLSLSLGVAGIEKYQYIAYGSVTRALSGQRLADLLVAIAQRGDDGLLIAVDILAMHLHGRDDALDYHLVAVGRYLIERVPLHKTNQHIAFELEDISKKCLEGPTGEVTARRLLVNLRTTLATSFSIFPDDFAKLVEALLRIHPFATLDELIDMEDGLPSPLSYVRSLESGLDGVTNPFGTVAPHVLIEWCKSGRSERWELLAAIVPPLAKDEIDGVRWSDKAVELLRESPTPDKVLEQLVDRLAPLSYSGSRAEIMARRLPLFDSLDSLVGQEHQEMVRTHRSRYQERIRTERDRELAWHRQENERFE